MRRSKSNPHKKKRRRSIGNKKFALLTVFLVVLVDLIGFGIVLPLLPFYALVFNASAVAIGLLYSIYSLAQLVFAPVWGAASDRIGRRPIMLMSTLGSTLAYFLFAGSRSLGMLFLSRLLAGLMGGNISAAQAYVADVTTPDQRAKGMGLIGAAFGLGFVLGPALASLLVLPIFPDIAQSLGFLNGAERLRANPYILPGIFAALLSLTSFLLVLWKLPESVKLRSESDPMRTRRQNIFSAAFWISLRSPKGPAVSFLPLLLGSALLLALGHSSLYSAFPLFCKAKLGLSAEKVGWLFAMMGLMAALVQAGLLRTFEKKFGEKNLFLWGSILMVTGLALIPLAGSPFSLTLILGVMTLGASLNSPTLQSLISKEADPHQVGSILGSAQGLAALGRTIGPAWGGFLFGLWYGFPFWITALFLAATIGVGLRLKKER